MKWCKRIGLIVLFVFIAAAVLKGAFVAGAKVAMMGFPAEDHVPLFLRHDDLAWLKECRVLVLPTKRQAFYWDVVTNRCLIDFDVYAEGPRPVMMAGDSDGNTNSMERFDLMWHDGQTNCAISIDTARSYIMYSKGALTLFDVDHDGNWDIRQTSTNKWYHIEGEWYPKKGEDEIGSWIEKGGETYRIRYSREGVVRLTPL